MSRKSLIVKPTDRKTPLDVVGTKVAVLASVADTQGQQITLQSGSEGTGPPPHSHGWEESFYVITGQVHFTCGGETSLCPAGTLVHIPAGTVHGFSYGPDGGEMLEITAGQSNAIQMFTAVDREIPLGPPDVPKLIRVLAENGVKVHL